MDLPIFYVPPESINDGLITLPSSEAHHATDVLRLQSGSLVLVVDGLGMAYRGELLGTTKKQAAVRVHSQIRGFGEPRIRLTLAAGLSVGYKFDQVVDFGTQLGVIRFVPLLTEKSRVKLADTAKAFSKMQRLEKVALAAMKQSRRSYRPEIAVPVTFDRYLQQVDRVGLKLMFHPSSNAKPLAEVMPNESELRVTILVGPEAGFSAEEEAAAVARGFVPVTLGARILRTENAGPVVCALVMEKLGELR
jgi:16S rRNA (uracil1498-N3)-methyltransferase